MRVTTVIHIGTPKAGSSTIQRFLGSNHERLRSLGVDFPEIGRKERIAHHNFVAELLGAKKFKPALGSLGELRAFYATDNSSVRIISAEMFERLSSSQINLLRTRLNAPSREFSILFILRDLVELMPSSYNQKITGGSNVYDFDTFFEWRIGSLRTNYFATAVRWAEVFQWERLRVRLLSPDNLVNGDLIDELLTVVGLDPDEPALRALPRPGVVNASVDWRVREALRALYSDRHGLPPNHPLLRLSRRSQRKHIVEPLAASVGAELGWSNDKGRYLTRSQAERALEAYRMSITALNERLPEKLPAPATLEERGFVERSFLPEAAILPSPELGDFYDRLGDAAAAHEE